MLPRPFESAVEALLPNPVYLLVVLLAAALAGWRLRRRWRWLALAGVLWAYAGTTPGVARALGAWLEDLHPRVDPTRVEPGADIVLLASGSVERHRGRAEVRLDTAAWERTAAAVELWHRAGGRLMVLGGPSMDGLSPAKAMAGAAVSMGVPTGRVTYDDRGPTTRTALELASRPPVDSPAPWMVTSALHMRRSVLAAGQAGWVVRPYPCCEILTDSPGWQQWVPSTLGYRQNIDILHEYVGLAYYLVLERTSE